MYGLALCLPSVGQPQGLPVPHEIPKTQKSFPSLGVPSFLAVLQVMASLTGACKYQNQWG